MKNSEQNAATDIFKIFLENIGLNVPDARLEVFLSPIEPDQVSFGLMFKIKTDYLEPQKSMLEFFKNRQEDVISSKVVSYEIKQLEQKLAMANKASDELLGRIKELEKYKIHYDLEIELRHGKKS